MTMLISEICVIESSLGWMTLAGCSGDRLHRLIAATYILLLLQYGVCTSRIGRDGLGRCTNLLVDLSHASVM